MKLSKVILENKKIVAKTQLEFTNLLKEINIVENDWLIKLILL